MKSLYCLVLLVFLLASCSAAPSVDTVATSVAATIAAQQPAQQELVAPTVLQPTDTTVPTNTSHPTNTPRPTSTRGPTNTPKPTNTPLPPTPTQNPYLYKPGTYLIGVEFKPGIYKGEAGNDIGSSCYWARLKDLSGNFDALIANDNSIGQFYVEIRDTDYALETRCEIVLLDSLSPPTGELQNKIQPGMYLIGSDIKAGTYKGQAGSDVTSSCYWSRLRDVAGEFDAIIANDNAVGQFYVQVAESDELVYFQLLLNTR